MTGIGLLIFIFVWGGLSILLGRLLIMRVIPVRISFKTENTNVLSMRGKVILLITITVIFFLPVVDELITYPTYIQMCSKTGTYEFGLGMNAEKVSGRTYNIELFKKRMQIFPVRKELPLNTKPSSGVVVDVKKRKVVDYITGEILLVGTNIKPIRSFFAIPWDGGRMPWLLKPCYANDDILHQLNLQRKID